MYDVQIDIEAAEAARDAMLRIRHSMNQHSAQHNNTLNWLEGLLSGAAAAVLDLANPLHALAPWEIWERWDFGGVARSCSATRGDVEQTRSEVRRTVEQLCHAHRGQLAPVIYDRAANMQSSLGRAHDILWTIVEMFNPGNILWLIRNPEAILDHFRGARGALAGALTLVEEYTGFLDGLLAREETLIAEIMRSPLVMSGAEIVGDIAIGVSAIPHLPGVAGDALGVVGFIADVVHGGKYDTRTLAVDGNAALIGVGITAIPIAGEVYNGLAIGSAGLKYVGWGLQAEGQHLQGQSRAQIDQLSSEWRDVSDSIDPDPLVHDLGKLASDFEGGSIQMNSLGTVDPGIGGFGKLGGDFVSTVKDTGSLVWGVANIQKNEVKLGVDSAIVESDVLARSAHAPGWLQGPLDWTAGPGKRAIDDVINFVPFGF